MAICVYAGVWGLGLATSTVRVDTVPLGMDQQSWVLTSDASTMHNGEVITKLSKKPMEGDILVSQLDRVVGVGMTVCSRLEAV